MKIRLNVESSFLKPFLQFRLRHITIQYTRFTFCMCQHNDVVVLEESAIFEIFVVRRVSGIKSLVAVQEM